MHHSPILIRHIRHLTDARYFAAMGVDWMSMELTTDPTSFSFWHAIRDWVEGVRLLAELPVPEEDLIARTLIDVRPDGLLIQDFSFMDVMEEKTFFKQPFQFPTIPVQPEDHILLTPSQLDSWKKRNTGHPEEKIFLEFEWTRDEIQKMLDSGYSGGFCFIAAHDELEKGLKDFSEMDDMMELLHSQ